MNQKLTIRGMAEGLMVKTLSLILPKYGKRAIFLTTLFIEIARISPSHKQMLEDLNQRIRIVSNNDALLLPASLHDAIWRKHRVGLRACNAQQLTEDEVDGICYRVIRDMPQWARYSDKNSVFNETRKVVLASLGRESTAA